MKQARRSTAQGATKIKKKRVGCLITQEQAADASGMSFWTYRRLEVGDLRDPGIRLVVNVALALSPTEKLPDALESIWEKHWPIPTQGLSQEEEIGEKQAFSWLSQLRDAAGLSQEAVAGELGISSRAYRDLELGRMGRILNPRISLLVRAADLYDLPLDQICEPEWLAWTRFKTGGADKPGDLDDLRAEAAPFLPPFSP